jgi:hypothetical protein
LKDVQIIKVTLLLKSKLVFILELILQLDKPSKIKVLFENKTKAIKSDYG